MKPREFSEEEVQDMFLSYVKVLIDYWEKVESEPSVKGKLEGLAFSILSTIDGSSVALPSFILAPLPAPEDKLYLIANGENYFPENHKFKVKCDISGSLHEKFVSKK